ncbi:uncharacterized protein LOC105160796 [Sesamum indicum]|uniref:Uncharacterized protein LOC105160796 n=1 Tax=Sesamum indicum TaxID=4182 RepID=A0A6I9T3G0_SESIN|nr:uncharacterized protein LOC105160796 [Sesamum indicum]XP_020548835.1 uncharacterized protein LOC105160796 [Sesamum indicum]
MDGESWAQGESLTEHRSEPKKRGILEVEETSDSSHKRVKMRDLESVFLSEAQAGRGVSNTVQPDADSDSRTLDLNENVGSVNCTVGDDAPACECDKLRTSGKEEVERDDGATKGRRFDLDLNAEDISSSINDPFYPYKNYEHLKSRDDSECGSSVGPLDERDSMRAWKGLKQNNYMSALHGAVAMPVPKPRGRKKFNNDMMKKKIELAKKEQVDRFARVAAPSGLLNGLNPGIINHVRNSKQVHSIIEALVRSERNENRLSGSKKCNQIKSGLQELTARKEFGDVHHSGTNTSGFNHGDTLIGRRHMSDNALFSKSVYPNTEVPRGNGGSCTGQTRTFSWRPSECNRENEDDKLALKLSSSAKVATGHASCLSNEESADLSSVTSLSVKAANVASQWLELLNQDIRGRLAALKRSKKRVRAVITTELPLLMSREFSSNLDKEAYTKKGSTFCHPDQATADAHSVRWSTLFAQMDKALSDEESHLESWLNQVKEMQLHCEKGLYKNSLSHAPLQTGPTGDDNRSGEADNSENDLAIRSAAASIYSTCNFLLSMENLPCC